MAASTAPLLGVIGGSGFYSLGVKVIKEIDIVKEVPGWPFGPTSSPSSSSVYSSEAPQS